MKKIVCVVLMIVFAIVAFAQQPDTKLELSKQDYLQKSRNQKTAAWIMLGGGTAMATGAMIWAVQDLFGPDRGEGVLFVTGVCAMAGSIPLFIASARNKRKANQIEVALTTKLEKATAIQNMKLRTNYYPAISLQVGFK